MYGSGINPLHRPASRQSNYAPQRLTAHLLGASRMRTPNLSDEVMSTGSGNNAAEAGDAMGEDDPRQLEFQERYRRTEARLLAALGDGSGMIDLPNDNGATSDAPPRSTAPGEAPPAPGSTKKAARTIDEDDYGDDDEDEEDDHEDASPLKLKSVAAANNAAPVESARLKALGFGNKPTLERINTTSSDQAKSSDDIRKKLEQDKKAIEDAARRSFNTMFYTLETDRDAMLEQQKLDELDRQVENELSGQRQNARNDPGANQQPGILGTTNLGGSIGLTMKHLIAKIDQKRSMVKASDAQLRQLINDVRRGRSKWASDEKVGQEELYEGLEKVLMELKASEHAHPFLQKVNKRDAPDYYSIIKQPMDIGTMMKKLKNLQYRSKKEFVDDLMLIWSNCLKYNSEPSHYLRKKALHMKKETERLVPLIPDIVVRDRAEVDAEERARNADLGDLDDSEDEEPIMASRGRKAPGKKGKGTSASRKAPPAGPEGTPGAESKPSIPSLAGAPSNLKNEFLRADFDIPMENGFTTPPPGSLTPLGINGVLGSGAPPSQADISELDGMNNSVNGLPINAVDDTELEDLEYKTWKQITKKDRAIIAAERHRLFRSDASLNVDEPAVLRSRAGMRRWMRHRKAAADDRSAENVSPEAETKEVAQAAAIETLAEGIEVEQDRDVPDYYDPVSAIPDLNEKLKWVEDSEGNLVDQSSEFLRIVPAGLFTAPESNLSRKMDANMKQMQNMRKICSKIGIVKQMQLQSQMYQNQFQKYDPQPFVEADIDRMVVSDDGPIMAKWTVRAALQRSIAKIFYHAGFEETQPAALDAVTDLAGDFFSNITKTFGVYTQAPKVRTEHIKGSNESPVWKSRFTREEALLHCLDENGVELEALESYAKDDIDRLGSKLDALHERYKVHLAELLRPALSADAGPDGSGAFADDSEQFVGGDFAEDIGEDFFGFKELGLDQEFGLATLSVPLHLLQNRMHNAYAAQNANATSTSGVILEQPPPFEPVTVRNITQEIGIVQEFFLKKLHDNGDQPLVEDDDLPIKQRFPKPRLPPTGKISSPRKRPIKEQQQLARKKRKLEEGKDDGNAPNVNGPVKPLPKPIGKLKFDLPTAKENMVEPEKDDASATGMMSPESM